MPRQHVSSKSSTLFFCCLLKVNPAPHPSSTSSRFCILSAILFIVRKLFINILTVLNLILQSIARFGAVVDGASPCLLVLLTSVGPGVRLHGSCFFGSFVPSWLFSLLFFVGFFVQYFWAIIFCRSFFCLPLHFVFYCFGFLRHAL